MSRGVGRSRGGAFRKEFASQPKCGPNVLSWSLAPLFEKRRDINVRTSMPFLLLKHLGLLNMVDKQPLGAGYYRLADIPPPWGLPADVKLRLHWMELIHRAEVQVAAERAERKRATEA